MYKSGLQLLRKGIKTEMAQWKQNEKWKGSEKGKGRRLTAPCVGGSLHVKCIGQSQFVLRNRIVRWERQSSEPRLHQENTYT